MSETHNASPYKGSGQLTREQFLFSEMRTTAKLIAEGLEDSEVIKRIVDAKLSAAKLLYCRPPGFAVMPMGRYLAGGLQSGSAANLIGVQYIL